jgi:adenylyl- and sulfurtransferase ThiI
MRQEFEDYMVRKGVSTFTKASKHKYKSAKLQELWEAWQNGWQFAVYAQRMMDEKEINTLRANIALAMTVLENKRKP